MTGNKTVLVLMSVTLLVAIHASATEIIFDDATGPGWSGSWHFGTSSTYVHSGTLGLEGDGQYPFTNSGLVDASDYILQFYVNTKSDAASNFVLRLSWTTDGTVYSSIPFDNRNVAAIYTIDDVDVPAASSSGVATDSDSSTWQKVEIDLTQTNYTGWPYQANTYIPGTSVLTGVSIITNSDVVLDDMRIIGVPEPATLSLVGIGSLLLLRKRRR